MKYRFSLTAMLVFSLLNFFISPVAGLIEQHTSGFLVLYFMLGTWVLLATLRIVTAIGNAGGIDPVATVFPLLVLLFLIVRRNIIDYQLVLLELVTVGGMLALESRKMKTAPLLLLILFPFVVEGILTLSRREVFYIVDWLINLVTCWAGYLVFRRHRV